MKELYASVLIIIFVLSLEGSAFAKATENKLNIPDSVFQSFNETNMSQAQIKAERQKAFDKMDINHDGRVSKDEFSVYEKTIFIEMNTKNDDVLTPEEVKEGCKSYFICLDSNQDKKVTAQEFDKKLDDTFNQIDTGKNNYITREEYLSYVKSKDKTASSKTGTNR
jgi:Ca2+-binding EF-hand superfamily protein